MKDVKNIINDLWNLFFPLLLRSFLGLIVLSFVINGIGKNYLNSEFLVELQSFMENSKEILSTLNLNDFLGIYLLVVFVLVCYIFNSLLFFVNSLLTISIGWAGYTIVEPSSFDLLLRYFPTVTDLRSLETEIHKVLFLAKKENKQNLADDEKWFNEKLTRFNQTTEILIFELLLLIIFSIYLWKFIIGAKLFFVLFALIIATFFNLSRNALEVRTHYHQIIYKLEQILELPQLSIEQAKELRQQIFQYRPKRWWWIRIQIIGDIRETIKNFRNIRIL